MGRAVLLRHDLPDGSSHYDWMIERAGNALITFRTSARVDQGGVGGFEAERIDDHRGAYVTYEGPVSGGRGTVSRVATGELTVAEAPPAAMLIVGRIGRAEGTFQGRALGGGRWRFAFVPSASA